MVLARLKRGRPTQRENNQEIVDNKVQEVSPIEVLPTVTRTDSTTDQILNNNVVTETRNKFNNESPEEIQLLGNELGRGERTKKMTQRMQESVAQ